jgi:hypothetical protein
MVSGLTQTYKMTEPIAQSTAEKVSAHGCALHAGVNALLDQAVKGGSRTCNQPDASAGNQAKLQVGPTGHARHRQHHADQRAKHNQLHHTRLRQHVKLTELGRYVNG